MTGWSATSRADALAAAHTSPAQIAAELNGGSVRALLVTADGATYGDPAISPDTTTGPTVAIIDAEADRTAMLAPQLTVSRTGLSPTADSRSPDSCL
jgi:hypothetical protein